MQFATYTFPSLDVPKQARSVEKDDGWWVRFGDDILVYSANEKWNAVTSRFKKTDRVAQQVSGEVSKGNMHLVVQKGRTFQQENPGVRVILNKGRYLVVDLAKSDAKRLAGRKVPCFHIEPLRENSVVFDTISRDAAVMEPNARVEFIVGELEQEIFEATIAHLVSYPTRYSTSSNYVDAANWALGALEGLGCATASVPVPIDSSGQTSNTIAVKTGTGGAGRGNIIIAGHLDSVNHPGGATAPAPGADDNASGSTGVLVMASVLTRHYFKHDLTFILFGGEEQGLHGSNKYVAGLSSEQRDRVLAVLNMDMIGTLNTPTPTVLLEGASLSQAMIDDLASAAATYTSLNIQTSLSPFASDHVPFINAGIPAVLTIEGADEANDAIHTENDTLDRVNVSFAVEILRMNLGFIAKHAVPVEKPSEGCGCSGLLSASHETTEALHILVSHYQNLFAQYARLNRDGRIDNYDYTNWQAARASHDTIVGIDDVQRV
jgi:hypothetical protein